MQRLGWTKAELSRQSGVPYHTLDKFLKGVSDKTSAENAQQLARALRIRVDEDADYEELLQLFYSATDTDRQFVLETVRRLVAKIQRNPK
jgi:transcriptional regulator with XRE-family HTH domain